VRWKIEGEYPDYIEEKEEELDAMTLYTGMYRTDKGKVRWVGVACDISLNHQKRR
jgi:hypothetical protein